MGGTATTLTTEQSAEWTLQRVFRELIDAPLLSDGTSSIYESRYREGRLLVWESGCQSDVAQVAALIEFRAMQRAYVDERQLHHREGAAKRQQLYRERHPERAYEFVRRARISARALWLDKKERAGGICQYCGQSNRLLTKDHIIPKSKGGTDHIDNLIPVCFDCNIRKGTKLNPVFIDLV